MPANRVTPITTLRQQAEAASATLPPLLLAAERVAATVAQGVHGRRRVGMGDAFWQFRRYGTGDPLGRIDWRQSAKTEHLFVRETEWAAAQSAYLWRDSSPSMNYRSDKSLPTKAERADILLMALSILLLDAGERIALLAPASRPISGHGALDRLLAAWPHMTEGQKGFPQSDLPVPRHAQIVLMSDFLDRPDMIEPAIRDWARRGVRGHMTMIADPAEETLPFDGRVRLEGMEAEGNLTLSRIEQVRDAYQQRWRAHRDFLSDLARRLGWGFTLHRTDHPPHTALLALYMHLTARPHGS